MLSPRTADFVETMIREGDEFNFRRWLQRVREEKAQAKQLPVALSTTESAAPEMCDQIDTSNRLDAQVNSGSALRAISAPIPRRVYRSDRNARGENSEDRLRLMRVSDAFDEFQESRVRDAIFKYLAAVFKVVVDYKGRRRTRRLLRRAFQFAGLPVDKNADPFAAVIRCTCERSVDNKTISKWARALRYAARCKTPRTPLKTFVKNMGGINACAERYAIYLGRGSQ
jgi:hypothetical protein